MKQNINGMLLILLLVVTIFVPYIDVEAATITIDGNITDWNDFPVYKSKDDNISKWSIAQDSNYVYFYVQENGGDEWNQPISNTSVNITYSNGTNDSSNKIQFTYNFGGLKDGWYNDIAGSTHALRPSKEANKYEAEFAVPKEFFEEDNFTINYCGTIVQSSDIKNVYDVEEQETTEAVYNGIVIDGTFSDWDAISKIDADNGAMLQTAAVFDGEYLYIYMKEKTDGAITWSGAYNNGSFSIRTDTGRDTVFKLGKDYIDGIEGAAIKHSNLQYEIAIPASAIKQYKETISFGYYMDDNLLIDNIANIQHEDNSHKKFEDIIYDGLYSDWDYYPHQLIQYSTPGGKGGDAEGALYLKDKTLYGHVKTSIVYKENEFAPFYIRINGDDDKVIGFKIISVDEKGKIDKNPNIKKLAPGTYEFYLWELQSGSPATNRNDLTTASYGKIYITIKEGGDEMEYKLDLEKLAEYFDMDSSDFKLIQANYIVIGKEWVSIAGTSSGASAGILLCILFTGSVLIYKKKKIVVK